MALSAKIVQTKFFRQEEYHIKQYKEQTIQYTTTLLQVHSAAGNKATPYDSSRKKITL